MPDGSLILAAWAGALGLVAWRIDAGERGATRRTKLLRHLIAH